MSRACSSKKVRTNSKKSLYEKEMNKKFISALLDMENGFIGGDLNDIAKDLRAATTKRRNSNRTSINTMKHGTNAG